MPSDHTSKPNEPRRGRGRPRHVATEETRRHVSALATACFSDEIISKHLRISLPTLRKHYKDELELSLAKANATIVASLQRNIAGRDVDAAIFMLKNHAGWTDEPEVLEPVDIYFDEIDGAI